MDSCPSRVRLVSAICLPCLGLPLCFVSNFSSTCFFASLPTFQSLLLWWIVCVSPFNAFSSSWSRTFLDLFLSLWRKNLEKRAPSLLHSVVTLHVSSYFPMALLILKWINIFQSSLWWTSSSKCFFAVFNMNPILKLISSLKSKKW